jgi:hypothetical protein
MKSSYRKTPLAASRSTAWKPLRLGLVGLFATFTLHGCSVTSRPDDIDVPQCKTYVQNLSRCFQRSDVSASIAVTAHSKDERDQMAARCDKASAQLSTVCP